MFLGKHITGHAEDGIIIWDAYHVGDSWISTGRGTLFVINTSIASLIEYWLLQEPRTFEVISSFRNRETDMASICNVIVPTVIKQTVAEIISEMLEKKMKG